MGRVARADGYWQFVIHAVCSLKLKKVFQSKSKLLLGQPHWSLWNWHLYVASVLKSWQNIFSRHRMSTTPQHTHTYTHTYFLIINGHKKILEYHAKTMPLCKMPEMKFLKDHKPDIPMNPCWQLWAKTEFKEPLTSSIHI